MSTLDEQAMICHKSTHRRRRGQTVATRWGAATVLSEGFDVQGRHCGWVGVPGKAVQWVDLCTVADATGPARPGPDRPVKLGDVGGVGFVWSPSVSAGAAS